MAMPLPPTFCLSKLETSPDRDTERDASQPTGCGGGTDDSIADKRSGYVWMGGWVLQLQTFL